MFHINHSPEPNGPGSDVLNAFEGSPGANLIISSLLRTNNPIIDILIAIMLPFILRFAFKYVYSLFIKLYKHFFIQEDDGVERIIEFENTQSIYGYTMNSSDYVSNGRNEILQKAISLFIGTQRRNEIMKFKKARVNLLAVKEDSDYDYDSCEKRYGSTYDQLQAYKLAPVPIWDDWMEIEQGLFFYQTKRNISDNASNNTNDEDENNNSSSNSKKEYQTTRIRYRLKAVGSDHEEGEKQISKFLQDAYNWYLLQMKQKEVGTRYFYAPLLEPNYGKSSSSNNDNYSSNKKEKKFQRYKLSDEKTFQSLFFPGKDKLLSALDTFSRKKGKYKISGFPYKLGLMLYGPPGTGKTSTIKAIANRLNRSIVNIPLSRIKTNQQLMDLIYDGVYEIGEDVPVKLGLQDVVYVIEDIDCASRVVHSRKKKSKSLNIDDNATKPNTVSRSISSQTNDGVGDNDENPLDNASPEELKKIIATMLENQTKKKDGDDDNDESKSKKDIKDNSDGEINDSMKSTFGFNLRKYFEEPDALNLSGILNTLDGVVDSPGRVIIITTNHPEKLDEALIRPGRIDQVIHLGYINYEQVIEMINHYYIDQPPAIFESNDGDDGTSSIISNDIDSKGIYNKPKSIPNDLLNRIRACFPTSDQDQNKNKNSKQIINRTPAEIECICAECDTIEDFVINLESDDGTSRTKFQSWE